MKIMLDIRTKSRIVKNDLSFPRVLYININNFKPLMIENISCVRGRRKLFFPEVNILFSYRTPNLFLTYGTNTDCEPY